MNPKQELHPPPPPRSHHPQNYSKTVEGWLALAQVVRYHQPPGCRMREIYLRRYSPLDTTQVIDFTDNMAVLRAVFPTLTAPGAYRNIYKAAYEGYGDSVIQCLGLLKRSHITHLWVNKSADHESFLAALIDQVKNGPVLQYLSLPVLSSEELIPMIEAISTLPPERPLTGLAVIVSSPADVRAVLSLAASTATHTLQSIRVMCFDDGFGEGGATTDFSIFLLLTIPTLRYFALVHNYWPFLDPAYDVVIADCVRARASGGAPPLGTLAFEDSGAEDEKEIIDMMKRESPSTSGVIADYDTIDRMLFG